MKTKFILARVTNEFVLNNEIIKNHEFKINFKKLKNNEFVSKNHEKL